jgi:tight adherence protein B
MLLPPVALSLAGAYGVYLAYTGVVLGWRGFGVGPARHVRPPSRHRRIVREWLAAAGLADIRGSQFAAVMAVFFAVGAAITLALFGSVVAGLCGGVFAGLAPAAAHRSRAERRRARARDAWPRLIEEIRLLTGSVGRSIPQALLDVGRHSPSELRSAFRAAEREWLISTDFDRTVHVLKDQLADPTADVICETLLVAYEVGGGDLGQRLAALAEDRHKDLQGRKDAAAKQSGVRFARRFVLIVPLGMALAGLSIGAGRAAYQTGTGQVAVLFAVAVLASCWLWAGRLLRLPGESRVFHA